MYEVHVLRGDLAADKLADHTFAESWERLVAACPWATPYQARPFAAVWYRIYHTDYEPLVVWSEDAQGELTGLFLLAIERRSGRIVNAGTHHAEYHTWLAREQDSDRFFHGAINAVASVSNGMPLSFLFLAPGTPLPSHAAAAQPSGRITLRWHSRGAMVVGEGSTVEASLRKSGNKSRLAKLKRLGAVELVQLHTRQELESVIDTIATQCDVRQGAVHQSLPFRDDLKKRDLYLALIEQPGLLHATVLRAGSRTIASHLGILTPKSLGLGVITHDPQYGEASPGKLLILLLGRLLNQQGLAEFDLTPGGSYKDRFATYHDQAASMEVHFSRLRFALSVAKREAIGVARSALRQVNLDASGLPRRFEVLRDAVRRLSRPSRVARGALVFARRWLMFDGEFRFYRYRLESEQSGSPDLAPRLKTNEIADLLCYSPPDRAAPSLTSFLGTSVARLEGGDAVFTLAEAGVLQHYSWLTLPTKQVGSEYGHTVATPGLPMVLWDDFTFPSARRRGLHESSLRERIAYARDKRLTKWCLIGVRADNAQSRRNIEKLGFEYCGSAFFSVRFGRKRRWTSLFGEPFVSVGDDE